MIKLTDNAIEKALELRDKLGHPKKWSLIVGVTGGGCSGFMYKFEFTEPMDEDDSSKFYLIEFDGINMYCDKKSYIFLNGTEIDYEETLMSSGFVFNNPLATKSCGCGESISFIEDKNNG